MNSLHNQVQCLRARNFFSHFLLQGFGEMSARLGTRISESGSELIIRHEVLVYFHDFLDLQAPLL